METCTTNVAADVLDGKLQIRRLLLQRQMVEPAVYIVSSSDPNAVSKSSGKQLVHVWTKSIAKPNRTPIKNKTKEPISSRQLADFSSSALASIAKKKIQSARTLLHVHKLEDSSSCRLVWIGFDAHQSAQSERNS
mmetsp:Transcript_4810/g.13864  ORF Transcript_4810/g.13864 Transcript_4810/m.13864 type:complete len:135 (+) Transcript_4810:11-415(+)